MRLIVREERITKEDYIEFLARTDLGSQYPLEDFEERIGTLVRTASLSFVARDEDKIVGVFFGLTDFAYWLFVTDLGVDRSYCGLGIGKTLMKLALKRAGGEDRINVYLVANDQAIPFYEKLGMEKAEDVYEYAHASWTSFVVE